MEYYDYDNMEVVTNDYTGNVMITSTGEDPGGDITGENDSGTYSFAWKNPETIASVNWDVSTDNAGTIQVIVNDANGSEVFNEVRPKNGSDTYSGVTKEGASGTWLVTMIITDLDGDASFSLHPGF